MRRPPQARSLQETCHRAEDPLPHARTNVLTHSMGIGTEVLIVLLLLVANGVFAMSEIAVVSARKSRLQQRAEEGDHTARRALELAENPERFLATVQVGITLV